MVDELLTYARLDENAVIHFERTDLVPLLEAITDDADFEGSATGTHVTLQSPDSIQMNMHVDSLMRAVENLVRNALRYSGPGQQVSVVAKEENEHVVITVTDSGPGMDPSELEKIFDPFVRGKINPRAEVLVWAWRSPNARCSATAALLRQQMSNLTDFACASTFR